MSQQPLIIAVLGAESTGKTTLAQGLSARMARTTGLRCTWVPEWLRQWCADHGRTPRADEQAAIAHTQHRHIEAATQGHDIVVADTTALMTAVYSLQIFGDASLREPALALHRRTDLTLLTALDLPWVPDGHQRDGPHVREPVDATVQQWLVQAGQPFTRVHGAGSARLDNALQACEATVQTWLRGNPVRHGRPLLAAAAQFTASEPGG
ncbi:MAG: AAA family ATPase [Rubrivivax sp.]|jgi:nicotinamide riboside kinase